MATVGQSAVLPGVVNQPASLPDEKQTVERRAGPVLFLAGIAYAAAYVVAGVQGLSPWDALLAIGGTAFVLLGLKLVAVRSS